MSFDQQYIACCCLMAHDWMDGGRLMNRSK